MPLVRTSGESAVQRFRCKEKCWNSTESQDDFLVKTASPTYSIENKFLKALDAVVWESGVLICLNQPHKLMKSVQVSALHRMCCPMLCCWHLCKYVYSTHLSSSYTPMVFYVTVAIHLVVFYVTVTLFPQDQAVAVEIIETWRLVFCLVMWTAFWFSFSTPGTCVHFSNV